MPRTDVDRPPRRISLHLVARRRRSARLRSAPAAPTTTYDQPQVTFELDRPTRDLTPNPGPPCPLPVLSECPSMQYLTIGRSSAPHGSSSKAQNGIGTLRKQAASHRRRLVIILHEPLEQRAWFYLQRAMRDARYLSQTHRTDHWKKNKTTECVHH